MFIDPDTYKGMPTSEWGVGGLTDIYDDEIDVTKYGAPVYCFGHETDQQVPAPAQPSCFSGTITTFDSDQYVRDHCSGYIYGLVTDTDISAIEFDASFGYTEKEEAKSQLEHLAMMYY